ncbi:MAG TPA: ISNCY family transposase [Gammaproteobacteria bacterium]|nr:ISNCY family transposase [Gammaproteobacteria bacterium]
MEAIEQQFPPAEMERLMKIQEVILKAMAGKLKWWEAAEIIGVTDRTMRRWREQYQEHGYSGLWDRRKQRPSPKRVPVEALEQVLRLYREKYFDFNVQHFHEKLRDEHGIHFSYTWVKTALQEAGLVSKRKKPGSHRKRRPRRALKGMMLHIDGSEHAWFGDQRRDELICVLDDATSEIYYAQLVEAESTRTIMAALREVIDSKGVFCTLYSDRAGHFFHTPRAGGKVDTTRLTQVGRAMQELGVKMIPAYSPEARGRGERNFGTWQGRLPQELRTRGIKDREAANRFLREEYILQFNQQFAVPAAQKGSAFVRCRRKDLEWIFSIQHERTVANDNTVAVENRVFQIETTRWRNTLAGQIVIVHEHLDGNVSIRYGANLVAQFAVDELPPRAPKRRGTPRLPMGNMAA